MSDLKASDTSVSFTPAATPLAEKLLSQAREILARYPQGRERSALLPLLHLVQSEEGYVSPAGVAFCAEVLGINKAQVGAVATFYTMYKRRPTGDYLVSVCTNTMCNVLGGQEVYDTPGRAPRRRARRDHRRRQHHPGARRVPGGVRLRPGGDGQLRLLRQRHPRRRRGVVEQLRAGERPAPTRGARLCTLKEMSLQLAGFADPRAEAVADGPAGRADPARRDAWRRSTASRCADFDPDTPIPRCRRRTASRRPPSPRRSRQARPPRAGSRRSRPRSPPRRRRPPSTGQGRRRARSPRRPTTRQATARGHRAGATCPPATSRTRRSVPPRPGNPDAGTPAPDAPGTEVPSGGPPRRPDARRPRRPVPRRTPPAGDGKPAGDEGTGAQERNLQRGQGGRQVTAAPTGSAREAHPGPHQALAVAGRLEAGRLRAARRLRRPAKASRPTRTT